MWLKSMKVSSDFLVCEVCGDKVKRNSDAQRTCIKMTCKTELKRQQGQRHRTKKRIY